MLDSVENIAMHILAMESHWEEGLQDSDFHWAHKMIMWGKNSEHGGDCTGAPTTCPRCVYEEYIAKAIFILSVIKED